jgi:hypothetical protein
MEFRIVTFSLSGELEVLTSICCKVCSAHSCVYISVYMYIFVSIPHELFNWYWVKINELHSCCQEKKPIKVFVTCSSRDWYDTGTCMTCCVRRVCYKVHSPVICHIFKIYVTEVFSSPELRGCELFWSPVVRRPSLCQPVCKLLHFRFLL